jgi:7-keto-8-aminopelargonate synthetase-like enzyme
MGAAKLQRQTEQCLNNAASTVIEAEGLYSKYGDYVPLVFLYHNRVTILGYIE